MSPKIYKIILGIAAICAGSVFCINLIFDIWWQAKCNSPVEDILSETEEHPAYVIWGELCLGDNVINISMLFHETDYVFEKVLCVKKEKAYVLCTVPYEETRCMAIGRVDLEKLDVEILYKATDFYANTYDWYDYTKDYNERAAYCYNAQIVLNDSQNVVVYDINSNEMQRYASEDYEFPERIAYGECPDSHTIMLYMGGAAREYTLSDMAETSEGISKIYELKDKKIYDGKTSFIQDLFVSYNSVQCTENRVYAIGRCMNLLASSSAVILEYDTERDAWIYVTGKYIPLVQNIHMNCYVIPWYK